MTDENTKQPGKAPTFIAYTVHETGNDENYWTRIGAAWPHGNGKKGFTLQLHAVPLDGKVVLMEPKAKD